MLTTKIFAVILGPNGIGLLAQLRQFVQLTNVLSVMGGQTPLVQGVASRPDEQRDAFKVMVGIFFAASTLLLALTVLIFSHPIAAYVFGESMEWGGIVRLLAVAIIFGTLSSYFSGILNGHRLIGRLAVIAMAGPAVNAMLAYPVSILVGKGYVMTFAWLFIASSVVSALLAVFFCWREKLLPHLRLAFQWNDAKDFFLLAGVLLVSGVLASGGLLLVRSTVAGSMGLAAAGHFDAAWSICMTYIMLVLGALGSYYMPTLIAIRDIQARREEIERTLRFVLMFVTPLIVFMVLFKPLILSLLYSDEFMPALPVIQWMLLGDFFKASAWVLAMPMLSFAEKRIFLVTEIVWSAAFAVGASLAVHITHNIEAVGIAFLMNYASYFLFTLWYARSRHGFVLSARLLMPLSVAFLLVLLASMVAWGDEEVSLKWAALFMLLLPILVWISSTSGEREQVKAKVRTLGMKA
jgi:PST family polysaccharide transporter